MDRPGSLKPSLIMLIALLACASLLRGPQWLSAWHNNIASLALRPEWTDMREAPGLPTCQQWTSHSAAQQPLAAALGLNPHSERARLNAGRLAWLQGDCEAALEAWGNLPSSDVIAHLERAHGLYALGRESEALQLYRQIAGAAEYLNIRGEHAAASHHVEEALAWYELSVRVLPTQAAVGNLVTIYLDREQRDAAVAVMDRLSEGAHRDNAGLLWQIGQSAQSAGDWELALLAFERGAQQSDEPCTLWGDQTWVLRRLEEWAAVEAISLQALTVCPQHVWPYLRLGGLSQRANDLAAAVDWYQQAEQLWPQDVNPKFHLGDVYFDQKEYERARGYLQQVLELEPNHAWGTYLMAWISWETGSKSTGLETLSRAIELHQGEPWSMAIDLGDWHLELGNREEALAAYRQALSWHPGDERIQQRIDRLTQQAP